ncbi:polysaccharide pyruvyl transferase family protein [Actinomadura montaniterrae]|uniref:Polysaccharide pyruvyl transferase family protein n=1 Tax=Actinomadura montaniterrae TaxID=1803903 RepID=A0A6L3VTV7_9ACTN|nr:polysaccharide pyruvyl transferase family protein [Actinomadura montaniterrae]KAB2375730.1 polysaccharide pyruvyl transferase family protein [Actinomadura montaniterrae]
MVWSEMIYLVGTTGFPNYGDELIAAAWLRYLAAAAPDTDVWLDCPHPGPAQMLLDGIHPRARFTDTFWRLCWEAPGDGPWEKAGWVRRAMHRPAMACRWVAGIELAARARIVHLIGGGYVNGIWPKHYGLLAAAVGAVERSGGRAVMTGQGLWPAPDDAVPLIRELAACFELADARDEPSERLLGGATAAGRTGDDLLLGLGPHLCRPPGEELREVMLCLQSDLLEMPRPALASFVTATMRAWGVTGDRIGVVEGIPGVDRVIFDLVEPYLPGMRFYPFAGVWANGLPAGPEQVWLSTRFHPHLVAAATGAAGVAVPVNPDYYSTKHRSLVDAGSGWALAEPPAVPERPSGSGFDPAALHALQQGKAALAAKIYS